MGSEGIAYGQMEGDCIFEAAKVEIGGLACIVGGMDSDTQVETKDEVFEIVAKAETCAYGQILEEAAGGELAAGMGVIAVHEPDIAGIDEEGTLQFVDDGESVLGIEFQFHVARLVEIGASPRGVLITARADAAHGKGPDAVGSANVEEFAVGCIVGVAEGPDSSQLHTGGDGGFLAQVKGVLEGEEEFEELGIGGEKEFFVFLVVVEAQEGVGEIEEVA